MTVAMESFAALEHLSLVAKITSELNNHLGISDKVIAEFIIDLHSQCSTSKEFARRLNSEGGDLPFTLIDSVDRLILTLRPKETSNKNGHAIGDDNLLENGSDRKSRIFKGLALPDRDVEGSWSGGESEDGDVKPQLHNQTLEDTFAELENIGKKYQPPRNGGSSRKRSRSPRSDDYGKQQGSGQYRRVKRSRSRSPTGHDGSRRSAARVDEYGRVRRLSPRDAREVRSAGRRFSGSVSPARHYDSTRFRDQGKNGRGRRQQEQLDDRAIEGKVYQGRATGLKDFGVFVNLHGVVGKVDGLVHISQMLEGTRVNHPSDIVSIDQPVWVKVVSISNGRIALSMKDVDQSTGKELHRWVPPASGANMQALNQRESDQDAEEMADPFLGRPGGRPSPTKKRMTSPERWEIKQLIAAGVLNIQDFPNIDEEHVKMLGRNGELTMDGEEEDEEVDIEVKEEEPPFLAGQTKQSLELSPIRVVKAPDGSLNRAAMAGTSLAKERREARQKEVADEAAEKANEVNLTAQWQDPLARERHFASDLRASKNAAPAEKLPEWKRVTLDQNQSYGKITSLSITEQRKTLPVYKFRDQLINAVKEHQLLVVVGETGSGKTTQLTQYLAEAGFANHGMIGCTQPRRVAAMSVAKRVAEEVGCRLGEEVGYTIRFEDMTSPQTRIKYMTDGMLQREVLIDPDLKRYSVIMLDEAHERTIATDILFGLLKKTVKRRPDLKVIITSATLDAEKFSRYFNDCPTFTIPGRTFPVEILYSREPETDYLDAALTTVMQIHLSEPAGDILLFLTGMEEIDTSCEILFERVKALGPNVPELLILPVYSALPSDLQSRIFDPAPPGSRKVVIATNIAETSITIDHIYYVIDPGFVKQNAFDPKLGMDSLVVTPISQAQAKQRAGRAGRTGPGKAFRLYTESAFESEMLPTSIPEIQRQNLSHTILMLKAMGINDLLHFDFMDPPPTNTMLTALEELYALSALDDEGLLTRLGRKMADFPMEPGLAKVLIASIEMGCSDEILSIVAMLSVQTIFYRPKEKQQQADQKKAKFHDPHGDHLTYLNVYNAWKHSKFSSPWCYENFIQARQMKRAQDVRQQLVKIMERYKHKVVSCGRDTQKVRMVLCAGFFRNSARKDPQEGYKTLIEQTPIYLHPSSALFGKAAEHVIYHTLVLTTKEYMHVTTTIEPKWLVEAAPTFFRVAPTDKLSKRKKAERIQPLYNRFAGEDEWRLSAQKRQGRGGGGGTWG